MTTKLSLPNRFPFFVVLATTGDSEVPLLRWFLTREEAIEAGKKYVKDDNWVYHVFETKRIASIRPQEPKVYEE